MTEPPVLLVVEDEYPVQGIVEDIPTEGGFASDILSSGEEALLLFKRLKNYRALLTDVALKGRLTGWDVAAQVREIDPSLPVIYMSGMHADEWGAKGVPNSVMLVKPFAPAQLVTAISQLINALPPNAPKR